MYFIICHNLDSFDKPYFMLYILSNLPFLIHKNKNSFFLRDLATPNQSHASK